MPVTIAFIGPGATLARSEGAPINISRALTEDLEDAGIRGEVFLNFDVPRQFVGAFQRTVNGDRDVSETVGAELRRIGFLPSSPVDSAIDAVRTSWRACARAATLRQTYDSSGRLQPVELVVDATDLAEATAGAIVAIGQNTSSVPGTPQAELMARLQAEPRAWTLACRTFRAVGYDQRPFGSPVEFRIASGAAPNVELVLDGASYDLKPLLLRLRGGHMPDANPSDPAPTHPVDPPRGLGEW